MNVLFLIVHVIGMHDFVDKWQWRCGVFLICGELCRELLQRRPTEAHSTLVGHDKFGLTVDVVVVEF